MRRFLLIVISLIALVVAGLLVFVFTFDANRYRPQIEGQLSKALNRKVTISKVGLRVFPLAIQLDDFSVAEADGFPSNQPFASAKQVFANASLLSLIQGKPEIQSLQLDQPKILLVRDKSRNWNFSSLNKGGDNKGSSSFSLGEFKMNDGTVAVIDLAESEQATTYDHIDVAASGFAGDKQFPLKISAHLPGGGKAKLELNANVGPVNRTAFVLTPLNGQLSLEEVSLATLAEKSSGTEGTVTGDSTVKMDNGSLTASGKMNLQGIKNKGVAVPFPVQATFTVAGDLQKELYHLQPLDLRLNQTPFQINGILDASHSPSTVSLAVTSQNTSITELAKLAGAFGASINVDASGTASLNIKLAGPVNALNYSGSAAVSNTIVKSDSLTKPVEIHSATLGFEHAVNAGTLREAASAQNMYVTVGATSFKGNASVQNFKSPHVSFTLSSDKIDVDELQSLSKGPKKEGNSLDHVTGTGVLDAATVVASGFTLNKVHAGVTLENGVVRLSPVTAGLFGGEESGTIVADLRPSIPVITAQCNLTGIDANRLLSTVSSAKDALTGSLAAKTNLQFSAASGNELIRTLNGTLGFNVTNGVLRNVDMIGELAKIAKFTGAPAPTGNLTPLKKLSGDMAFAHGVANTSNLTAVIPQGSLAANGTVNMVDQGLDMKLTAVLLGNLTKTFGGSSIGGLMQTALANKKGELVIPAFVRGTMSKPSITPDTAAIAKMQMQNLLPTAGNPGALTSGILGAVTGKGDANSKTKSILDAVTGGNQQQQGGLGGLLQGLTKRKNDKKQ